jgi:hypothetical protein
MPAVPEITTAGDPDAGRSELRALFIDAHEQLFERDEELLNLARVIADRGWTASASPTARALGADARRDATIRELRRALTEQAEWAARSASVVVEREARIHQLEAEARGPAMRIDRAVRRLARLLTRRGRRRNQD